MTAISSTDVRKDWSRTIDSVIRNRPAIIKRTHDYMILSDIEIFRSILSIYKYSVSVFTESDGSITVSADELDLADNGKNLEEAKLKLANDIAEYAEDYYANFDVWTKAPNRKEHLPYVLKTLINNSADAIIEDFICHDGKN